MEVSGIFGGVEVFKMPENTKENTYTCPKFVGYRVGAILDSTKFRIIAYNCIVKGLLWILSYSIK